jgi:hypothetical protein
LALFPADIAAKVPAPQSREQHAELSPAERVLSKVEGTQWPQRSEKKRKNHS